MTDITEKEILEALEKSGYLLESEITKLLAQSGFFVESNKMIEDPITGKGREIDLIAELYEFNEEYSNLKTHAGIKYVFEIKNNPFPVVLLTKLEFSPNIEPYESLKEIITIPKNLEYNYSDGFYRRIFSEDEELIFTQYCSFNKKKANDDLMALHPDNVHDSLLKIVNYCDKEVGVWGKDENEIDDPEFMNEFFRHIIYLPILLLNEDLFELEIDKENNRNLRKVNYSKLLYNYYYQGEPKMCMVYFVTKNGFSELMNKLTRYEKEVFKTMIEIKKGGA